MRLTVTNRFFPERPTTADVDPRLADDPEGILFTFALGSCECELFPQESHCVHGWPSELTAIQTALQPQES